MDNSLIKREHFEITKYTKIEYIVEQDYLDLLSVTTKDEHRLLLRLLWETGLRISEALTLKYSDIYPDGLNIVGKRGTQRFVPCQAQILGELMRYKDTHGDNKIFQKVKTEPGALYMMRRYAKKSGLSKRIHPHLFRHSFAINFLKQTGDPFSLQDILGHASMDMVKIYMRLAKEQPREQIKRMYFPKT